MSASTTNATRLRDDDVALAVRAFRLLGVSANCNAAMVGRYLAVGSG
jgi:hypothetical protein